MLLVPVLGFLKNGISPHVAVTSLVRVFATCRNKSKEVYTCAVQTYSRINSVFYLDKLSQ